MFQNGALMFWPFHAMHMTVIELLWWTTILRFNVRNIVSWHLMITHNDIHRTLKSWHVTTIKRKFIIIITTTHSQFQQSAESISGKALLTQGLKKWKYLSEHKSWGQMSNSQKTSHNSPVRARYGMSSVSSNMTLLDICHYCAVIYSYVQLEKNTT